MNICQNETGLKHGYIIIAVVIILAVVGGCCWPTAGLQLGKEDDQDGQAAASAVMAAVWGGLPSTWLLRLSRGWTSKNREKYW